MALGFAPLLCSYFVKKKEVWDSLPSTNLKEILAKTNNEKNIEISLFNVFLSITFVYMKKQIILLSCLILVLGTACRKSTPEKDPAPTKRTPGYFVLNQMGKQKNGESTLNKTANSFNLGEIKASRNYLFILSNGGQNAIFDIHLVTNDSAYNVSPSYIEKIENGLAYTIGSSTGIIPVVNLEVTHGMRLNGVGFDKLLPQGANTAVINVYGKTLDASNDTIDVYASFSCDLFARVMDLTMYHANKVFDITKPQGYTTHGALESGLGFNRYYVVYRDSMHFENTGNVPIRVTYELNSIVIDPGVKQLMMFPTGTYGFKLESNGTITDNSRIQLGKDGNGYFAMDVK